MSLTADLPQGRDYWTNVPVEWSSSMGMGQWDAEIADVVF